MSRINKKTALLVFFLIAIVFLAALFRSINLKEQGLFFWDEALYLIKAESFANIARECFLNPLALFNKREQFLKKVHADYVEGGIPLGREKPFYSFLIAILSLFIGIKDYTPLLVSSFLGTATVVLIFFVSKSMYGIKEGIFSSLMLALSCFHVMYSRLGFAETTSCFFVLLAVFVYYLTRSRYIHSREKYLFLTGIIVGIAIATHYRCYVIAFLLLSCEMHFLLFEGKHFSLAKRATFFAIMLLSIMIIPVFLEIIFKIILYISRDFAICREGYFSRIIKCIMIGAEKKRAGEPFLYFLYLFKMEGIIFISLLITGIITMIRNRKFEDIFLLYLIFVPLALYMAVTYKPPRAILMYFPFFCIISSRVVALFKRKYVLFILVLILLVVTQLVKLKNYINLSSGYTKAARFIVQNNYDKIIVGNTPLGVFYFGEDNTFNMPKDKNELYSLYKEKGVNVIIVDFFSDYFRHALELRKHIKAKASPIFKTNSSILPIFIYENSPNTENVGRILKDPSYDKVEVYNLKDIF